MTRRADNEAATAAARLEADDWAAILTRWAMMLDHMPPDAAQVDSVRHAATQVAARLPVRGDVDGGVHRAAPG